MFKFWKKEKENKKQIEDNEILNFSETIVNHAFKIDRWGKKSFQYALICIFIFFYVRLFYLNEPKSEIDIFLYENILPLTSNIVFYLFNIFFYLGLFLLIVGMLYKGSKNNTYDKKRVINLYLKELIDNPNKTRKKEILKHLTYNLNRYRDDFKIKLIFFNAYDWKQYFRINQKKSKFQYQVIDKFSFFIENAIVLLNINQYKDFITQAGELILNEDYHGINQLYNKNDKLFEKIKELMVDFNFTKKKKRIDQLKNFIVFTSNNYKFIIAILIIVAFIYFVFTGELSSLIFNLLGI